MGNGGEDLCVLDIGTKKAVTFILLQPCDSVGSTHCLDQEATVNIPVMGEFQIPDVQLTAIQFGTELSYLPVNI